MTQIPIRIIPDPVLRQKAKAVTAVDKRVAQFMEDMLESMYKGHGIGLAANQVGSLERVITVDVSEQRNATKALLMANPEIVWSDPDEKTLPFASTRQYFRGIPREYCRQQTSETYILKRRPGKDQAHARIFWEQSRVPNHWFDTSWMQFALMDVWNHRQPRQMRLPIQNRIWANQNGYAGGDPAMG